MEHAHMKRAVSFRSWWEAELPAALENVAPTLQRILDDLKAQGLSDELTTGLQLPLTEALNNAVIHGCAGKSDALVRVGWSWSGEWLEVEVCDPGNFVPSAAWNELPADPLAEGGRGGFLITTGMDSVAHENGPTGHALVMRKKVGVCPRPAASPSVIEQEQAAMTQDLSDSYESLSALFQISELYARESNFSVFVTEVVDRLQKLVSAEMAYVRLSNADGTWRTLEGPDAAISVASRWPAPMSLTLQAIRERHEILVENSNRSRGDDPLSNMNAGGFILPLIFMGQALGALVVGRRTGNFFSASELSLLRTIGEYLATACATADLQKQRETRQRVERELEIAASIQSALLPRRMPAVPGWKIWGTCESATEVGGDFFDLVEQPGAGLLMVIADVMGKGLPAALLATVFRTSLRARPDLATDPGALLTVVNRQIHGDLSELGMFITAQVAWFETSGQRVRLASAGHGDGLLLPAGGRAFSFVGNQGGMPIGVLEDTVYVTADAPLAPDDTVLFFTDGLYEIEGLDGSMLGLDGFAALARKLWNPEPSVFRSELFQALHRFAREGSPPDDRTLVTVTRQTSP